MLECSTQNRFSCQWMEKNWYSRAQIGKLSWDEKINKSRHPSQLEIFPIKERYVTIIFKEKRTDVVQQNNSQRMTLRPEVILGVFLGVTLIVITFNQELNSVCRKKDHSLQLSRKLMLSGGQIRRWMYCRNVA